MARLQCASSDSPSVVLPDPDSPTRPRISPRRTVMDTPLMISTSEGRPITLRPSTTSAVVSSGVFS